jgi:hypothetical protein
VVAEAKGDMVNSGGKRAVDSWACSVAWDANRLPLGAGAMVGQGCGCQDDEKWMRSGERRGWASRGRRVRQELLDAALGTGYLEDEGACAYPRRRWRGRRRVHESSGGTVPTQKVVGASMAKLAVWACGGEGEGDWYGHKIGADH